jgi:hypothetical protein
MKSIWLLGLMSLLLTAAYNMGSAARADAQNPERPLATPAPADTERGENLPARFSEYLFLHQTRDESFPVHAMVDVKACSE